MRVAIPLCLLVGPAAAGCIGDIRVCDIRAEENVCSDDGDCVMAYCATDCRPCANAYAARQVDSTYCLTRQGETSIPECHEGKDERCRGALPPVCAHGVEPFCNAGKCDLRPAR